MAKHTHRNKRNNIKKRLNKRNTLKKSNTIKRKKSLEIKNKSKKKTQRGGIEERIGTKDETAKRKLIDNITQGHTFYIHCPREKSDYYSEFFKDKDEFNNDFNRRKCITKMVKDSYNHQYRFFATKKPTTKLSLLSNLSRKKSRMMQFVYTKNNDNEYDCFLITYKKDENYDYTSYREDELGLNEMENREMEEPMRYPYDIHDVLQVYLKKKHNRNITYKTLNNSNEMLCEDPLLVIEKLKKIKHEKHRNIKIQLNGDDNWLNITMSNYERDVTNRHEWNIGNKMKKGKKMEDVEACFWEREKKFEKDEYPYYWEHPYYWGGNPCYYKEEEEEEDYTIHTFMGIQQLQVLYDNHWEDAKVDTIVPGAGIQVNRIKVKFKKNDKKHVIHVIPREKFKTHVLISPKRKRRLPFTNIYSSTLLKFLPEFHYLDVQKRDDRPNYFKTGDNYKLLLNDTEEGQCVVEKNDINDTHYFDLALCKSPPWKASSWKIWMAPSPIYALDQQTYSIDTLEQEVMITNPMIQLLENLLGNSLIHKYGIKIIYNTNLEISAVRATTTEK